jgi:hypothetical protein
MKIPANGERRTLNGEKVGSRAESRGAKECKQFKKMIYDGGRDKFMHEHKSRRAKENNFFGRFC